MGAVPVTVSQSNFPEFNICTTLTLRVIDISLGHDRSWTWLQELSGAVTAPNLSQAAVLLADWRRTKDALGWDVEIV